MHSSVIRLSVILLVAIVAMPSGVSAFGAGNIPSVSAIEGKNFRHGDIEDTLATVIMSAGGLISKLTGGKKFNDISIKRVYFGNWLRDYSQAVDVGTLSRGVGLDTIRVFIWVLSFVAFGYATEEFEVSNKRLGVYRPEEHIDNPKDYAGNQDARKYDPRLRGPVDPQELGIDPQTGMKNYIANDRGGWSTSSQYIRSSLEQSIHCGRRYCSSGNKADQFLGALELPRADITGTWYENVFPHVGTQTAINLNGKRVYPLITGTFGSLDFLHSLLGEAQDHLSQTEVQDLHESLEQGRDSTDSSDVLKGLLSKVPISIPSTALAREKRYSSSRGFDNSDYSSSYYQEPQMTTDLGDEIDRLTADSRASAPNANNMNVEEIIQKIYPFLAFRDKIMKAIDAGLEKIPFLDALIEKISDTLTVFVMGLIAPFVTPLIEGVVKQMQNGSQFAVENKDQEEVWHDPNSDNPTHSYLSKDHFSLYLNEPAGKVAKEVLSYVVPLIVQAWENTNIDPDEVLSKVLHVFHHPALARTEIQHRMRQVVQTWVDGLGRDKNKIISSLSSDGVLSGTNHIGGKAPAGGHDHGSLSKPHKVQPQSTQQHAGSNKPSNFVSNAINVAAQAAGVSRPHWSSQIPSKFPGANLINSAANINKLSHQFGLRESDYGYTESQSYGTDLRAGDKYVAQSITVQSDDGYSRQHEYTSVSSSGQNASYYSQQMTYSGPSRDDISGHPGPSLHVYDGTGGRRQQELSYGFDNLRIKDDYSSGYQGGYNEPARHYGRHEFRGDRPGPPSGYGISDDSYGGEYYRLPDGPGGYGDDPAKLDDGSGPGIYGGAPGDFTRHYDGPYGSGQPPPSGQFQGAEEYYPDEQQPPYAGHPAQDSPSGGGRGGYTGSIYNREREY
ncbi:heterokaryon incompatibility protein Het-C-domain-containing protein [Lipomyces mesembrius]